MRFGSPVGFDPMKMMDKSIFPDHAKKDPFGHKSVWISLEASTIG